MQEVFLVLRRTDTATSVVGLYKSLDQAQDEAVLSLHGDHADHPEIEIVRLFVGQRDPGVVRCVLSWSWRQGLVVVLRGEPLTPYLGE